MGAGRPHPGAQAAPRKDGGQETRRVQGIGFRKHADLPAGGQQCRQGAKSVTGSETAERLRVDGYRSDRSCGATTRSRNTYSTRSPGFAPGRSARLSQSRSQRKGAEPCPTTRELTLPRHRPRRLNAPDTPRRAARAAASAPCGGCCVPRSPNPAGSHVLRTPPPESCGARDILRAWRAAAARSPRLPTDAARHKLRRISRTPHASTRILRSTRHSAEYVTRPATRPLAQRL